MQSIASTLMWFFTVLGSDDAFLCKNQQNPPHRELLLHSHNSIKRGMHLFDFRHAQKEPITPFTQGGHYMHQAQEDERYLMYAIVQGSAMGKWELPDGTVLSREDEKKGVGEHPYMVWHYALFRGLKTFVFDKQTLRLGVYEYYLHPAEKTHSNRVELGPKNTQKSRVSVQPLDPEDQKRVFHEPNTFYSPQSYWKPVDEVDFSYQCQSLPPPWSAEWNAFLKD